MEEQTEIYKSASASVVRRPKILLADDHAAVSKAVTGIVAPHFDVVATVNNGKAALEAVAETNPDVLVTDIAMPEMDGIQAARELVQRGSSTKIVFLTGQEDDDYIAEALNCGAKAYVVKRRMQTDLIPALNSAQSGDLFVSPYVFASRHIHKPSSHVLELYLNERVYFEQVAERTYKVLAEGKHVFMFLSKVGLSVVRRRLHALGLNWSDSIERGDFRVFSVENIVQLLIQDAIGSETIEPEHLSPLLRLYSTDEAVSSPFRTYQVKEKGLPNLARFREFFSQSLDRAAARARECGSQVTIISNLLATLLRQGSGHDIATRIEQAWNAVIPSYSCVVHCGYPLNYLAERKNRALLSEICGQHGCLIHTGTVLK